MPKPENGVPKPENQLPLQMEENEKNDQNDDKSSIFKHSTYTSHYPNPSFNRYGRGYPDISLAGVNYLTIVNQTFYSLSGTSASSPVFAGII